MIRVIPSKSATLVLLCLATLFAGGCVTDRQVIDQANAFNTDLKPAIMDDPVLADYIQKVGDRIIDAAQQLDQEHVGPPSHFKENDQWMFGSDMKFHFVNSKTLNAFTTGGHHMYVYDALFQQCKSEDELAAVMAHEFAHVYCRHVQQGMQTQYAIVGATVLAGGAGYVIGGKEHGADYASLGAGLGAAVGNFMGMGFTRDDEAEADQYGFKFYVRAGYDPNQFGNFFQQMIDLGYDKGVTFLSDHPSLQSRVEAAQKRAAALPASAQQLRRPPVADAARFAQLQAIAREDAKHTPDDKSLDNTQELLAALPRSCLTPAVHADQIAAEQDLKKKIRSALAERNQEK